MKITSELQLTDFNFWSGAKDHSFTYSELQEIENILPELFNEEGATETQINDLFWFEEEYICELICIDYEKDYLTR